MLAHLVERLIRIQEAERSKPSHSKFFIDKNINIKSLGSCFLFELLLPERPVAGFHRAEARVAVGEEGAVVVVSQPVLVNLCFNGGDCLP